MTPERIAELRTWFPFDSSTGGHHYDQVPDGESLGGTWHRLLDEIERLRGLLAEAHVLLWSPYTRVSATGVAVCAGVCPWEMTGTTHDNAATTHAAHVAEILNGGAK